MNTVVIAGIGRSSRNPHLRSALPRLHFPVSSKRVRAPLHLKSLTVENHTACPNRAINGLTKAVDLVQYAERQA